MSRPPPHVHGKEGVDGSSPSEGFHTSACIPAVVLLPMFVLDNLTQLCTIGLDNEVDRGAVSGPRLRRSDAARPEGQRRVLALGALTWLAHVPEPKIPEHRP